MRLYAILDKVAQALAGPVFSALRDEVAVRTFSDIAVDPSTMVGRHPQDFDLICVGEMDDLGSLSQLELFPVVVLTGASWLALREAKADAAFLKQQADK